MVIVFGFILFLLLLSLGTSMFKYNRRENNDPEWFWNKELQYVSGPKRSLSRDDLEALRQLLHERIGVDVTVVETGFKLQASPHFLQEVATLFFANRNAGVAPEIDFWDQDAEFVADSILIAYLKVLK